MEQCCGFSSSGQGWRRRSAYGKNIPCLVMGRNGTEDKEVIQTSANWAVENPDRLKSGLHTGELLFGAWSPGFSPLVDRKPRRLKS